MPSCPPPVDGFALVAVFHAVFILSPALFHGLGRVIQTRSGETRRG